jgi:hypothetical protein
VKWLCRLELADRRAASVFTTTLYNDPDEDAPGKTRPVWEAPPESLIVSPPPDATLARAPVEIWGWAWAAKGVARVEVSTDGGTRWSPAMLERRADWSWQRFALPWTPLAPGAFSIMARAADTAGTVQRLSLARNAVHAVPVTVSENS